MRSNEPREEAKGAGLAPWQLERARRMLSSATAADHEIVKIAEACGLSRSYFGRSFKVSTGLSPHQWLLHHRVECACHMLDRGEESISAIALRCGFADQSHFTRVFHSLIGASPGDWRRQQRSVAPI
jgi:AraC family transcriptional regulator